jgi:hypothetical protein
VPAAEPRAAAADVSLSAPLPREAFAAGPHDAGLPRLYFESHTSSCFGGEDRAHVLALGEAAQRDLRAVIERSKGLLAWDGQALGITRERLERERPRVLAHIAESSPHLSAEDLERARALLDLDTVLDVAFDWLESMDSSTSKRSVKIELPSAPATVISSAHNGPGGLPWRVQVGAESWETYSVELPLALARYLKPVYPEAARELDPTTYWERGFWDDTPVWYGFSRRLSIMAARRMLETLPGQDALQAQFSVESASLSRRNLQPEALYVELRAPAGAVIDRVDWYNHLQRGRPAHSARQLLAQYARVSAVVQRLTWLSDWKELGGQRTIEAHIAGERLHDEHEDVFQLDVAPSWRHAGLPGEPTVQLLLRREGEAVAELYTSEATRRVLVTSANLRRRHGSSALPHEAQPAHWLEREIVSTHRSQPEFILVDEQGNMSRHRIE